MRTSSIATPKPCISAFTWSRIMRHDPVALGRQHVEQLFVAEHAAQRRRHDRIQPRADAVLGRPDRLVVLQRIGDAVHGEAVDDQPALVAQDHLLARQLDSRAGACRS